MRMTMKASAENLWSDVACNAFGRSLRVAFVHSPSGRCCGLGTGFTCWLQEHMESLRHDEASRSPSAAVARSLARLAA